MTDLQQTLLITNFHNIIQELEGYSSHTFTTFSQHTSSTTNINIVLCDRLFITYFHNIITNSSSNISTSFNTSSTHLHHASTNSSTSFNKMNEYRFSFTAYSTNSSSTFIHIHFNKSWYNSLSILQQHTSSTISIFHFFITSSTNIQRTLTKHSSQQIEWCIIHYKHSTNIFEKRPSKLFITNISTNYDTVLYQYFITNISTNYDTVLYQYFITNISTNYDTFLYQYFITNISTNYDTFLHQYFSTNIHNRRVGYRSFIVYFNEYFITSSLHTSTNTSSWLSDRSSTNLSQQHIQMVIHYIHSTNSSSIFIISLSQNSHNKLWYNSSLYIIQRTSVSFVNVRIVHTSYHKTFITLQQTMKQFFITKLSKQSSLVSHINFIMLISSC